MTGGSCTAATYCAATGTPTRKRARVRRLWLRATSSAATRSPPTRSRVVPTCCDVVGIDDATGEEKVGHDLADELADGVVALALRPDQAADVRIAGPRHAEPLRRQADASPRLGERLAAV